MKRYALVLAATAAIITSIAPVAQAAPNNTGHTSSGVPSICRAVVPDSVCASFGHVGMENF